MAAAASAIERDFGVLDVLVNNAAVKLETSPSPPSSADVATVRATFETNVFGAIRVTLAALPLLRRSARPRIVNVSSILGSTTLAATPGSPIAALPLLAYNSSKACAELGHGAVRQRAPRHRRSRSTPSTPAIRAPT